MIDLYWNNKKQQGGKMCRQQMVCNSMPRQGGAQVRQQVENRHIFVHNNKLLSKYQRKESYKLNIFEKGEV